MRSDIIESNFMKRNYWWTNEISFTDAMNEYIKLKWYDLVMLNNWLYKTAPEWKWELVDWHRIYNFKLAWWKHDTTFYIKTYDEYKLDNEKRMIDNWIIS